MQALKMWKNGQLMQMIVVIVAVVHCALGSASEIVRLRGVSLSRAPLYRPDVDFTCFDGSLTIPFTQVNDDFCDCADASDEPGTAACPHGTFHCTNAGHRPLNIGSHRVNDGICDCCDASDEYHSRSKCANTCKELGRSARDAAQKRAQLLKAGRELRAALSEKAAELKKAKEQKLSELKEQKLEAERVMAEKDALKMSIETQEAAALEVYKSVEDEEKRRKDQEEEANNRAEAGQVFFKYDSNDDNKVDISELQTRATFDRDKNGEVAEDEARYFLNDKESVDLDEFVSECWSRVKPFILMEQGMFKGPESPGHGQGVGTVEEVDVGRRDHEDIDGDDEEDEEGDDHDYGQQAAEHGDDLEEEEEEQVDEPEVPEDDTASEQGSKYDEATQQLIDQATAARNAFNDADRNVRNIQSEITSIEDYLKKDYGPVDEFAPLEGECFEFSDYEYVYKLCPFDQATQTQKSGSSETRLGSWGNWLHGNNDQTEKYSGMMYDKGQSCWNGPQRTCHVQLACGAENRLTGVSEPNRCEYRFDFETPAACRPEPEGASDEDFHDEL